MNKVTTKYIDKALMNKRLHRWRELKSIHDTPRAVFLFREEYKSDPTVSEGLVTGTHIEGQHVYFITDGEYIKIGISNDTRSRLKSLQTANARKLRVAAIVPYGGIELETELHLQFAHLRAKGEWFKISKDLEKYIKDVITTNYVTYGKPLSQCVVSLEVSNEI